MKAEDINAIGSDPSRFASQLDRRPHKPASHKEQPHYQDVAETPPLDHIRFNELERDNGRSRDMAQQIRSVSNTMAAIDGHLQQMQAQLSGIVKMYPPYPPESSERIEALRQFSALRQMIDHLASPGGGDDMLKILGNPELDPNAGDWSIPDTTRLRQLTIHHQPVHGGKDGLDLPEPDPSGTDDQLNKLLDRTTAARQTLLERRQAFISDANRIIAMR